MRSTTKLRKIALIGAGFAGLVAAKSLIEKGFHVTVFEKSRGSGGRMATKTLDADCWDMGAQFFRAHSQAFQSLLDRWQEKRLVAPWSFTPYSLTPNHCIPSPDSSEQSMRFVGTPKMTSPTRYLLSKCEQVHLQTRISSISYENHNWSLLSDQREHFSGFEHLILNMPPTQAAKLINTIQTEHAHEKALQIPEIELEPVVAALFRLPTDINLPFQAAFVKQSAIGWLANNDSKPERKLSSSNKESDVNWVAHATPGWSKQFFEQPLIEIEKALTNEIFNLLHRHGTSSQALSKAEIDIKHVHRWRFATANKKLKYQSLHNQDLHLSVCGDWLAGNALQGAFDSGVDCAKHILSACR